MDLSMEKECLENGTVSEENISKGLAALCDEAGWTTSANAIRTGCWSANDALLVLESNP